MSETIIGQHSPNVRDLIYNEGVPGPGDPSEEYFEASKLTRSGMPWETPGVPALLNSPELQLLSTRAGRRYLSHPFLEFPEVGRPSGDLVDLLRWRRSVENFSGEAVSLAEVAGVLEQSYGVYEVERHQLRRNTPSGGALYPLDLYLVARNIEGLPEASLFHYDPFRHGLALLASGVDLAGVDAATLRPEFSSQCAAYVLVSASFWRSRFKYSQRALRFTFLEAGHLAQNILLLAQASSLGTRLVGGFVDSEINAILPDHNGVDDAVVYLVELGRAM